MGLRERKNIDLIACPSCGRAEIDVIAVAKEAMEAFGRKGTMHMTFKAEPDAGSDKKTLCVQASLTLIPEAAFDEEWEEASERGVPNERLPDRTFDA